MHSGLSEATAFFFSQILAVLRLLMSFLEESDCWLPLPTDER